MRKPSSIDEGFFYFSAEYLESDIEYAARPLHQGASRAHLIHQTPNPVLSLHVGKIALVQHADVTRGGQPGEQRFP